MDDSEAAATLVEYGTCASLVSQGIYCPKKGPNANAEGNQVNHSGVATVDVRPILAVFQDGSSESMDKASFHHLMDGVKNDAEGTRMVLSTLQKSTNDPAKAVASLEKQRKYAAPQSLYDRQLRDAIAFLKKSPAPSELEAYRRRLQKSYDTLKPYAYLQPGGVK